MEEYIIEVNPGEVDMPFNGIRLVRCKDCKKRYTEECGLRLTYMPQDDMFYCAAGRKEDG